MNEGTVRLIVATIAFAPPLFIGVYALVNKNLTLHGEKIDIGNDYLFGGFLFFVASWVPGPFYVHDHEIVAGLWPMTLGVAFLWFATTASADKIKLKSQLADTSQRYAVPEAMLYQERREIATVMARQIHRAAGVAGFERTEYITNSSEPIYLMETGIPAWPFVALTEKINRVTGTTLWEDPMRVLDEGFIVCTPWSQGETEMNPRLGGWTPPQAKDCPRVSDLLVRAKTALAYADDLA